MLVQFLRLNLPMFAKDLNKDALDFLITCEDRLYNFGHVETHGLNILIYSKTLMEVILILDKQNILLCHELNSLRFS